MLIKPVEIYSDATNYAVMRHPERKFPGMLIQGDTLHSMCEAADRICEQARRALGADAYGELNDLRNSLWERLNHYKQTLGEHGIPLPFSDNR